jgi:peptidoglycan/LPS O-acetylase OafA/YrhL
MYWIAYVAAASLIFLSSAHLPVGAELGKIFLTVVGLDGFLYYKIPNYYLVGEWFVGMILCLYIAFPILRALVLKSPRITIFIFVMVVIVLDYCYGRLFEMAEIRNPLILAFPMIFGMVFSLKYHVLNKFWMLLFSLLATIYVCLFRIPIPYTLSVLLVSVVFFCTLVFLCEVISLDKIMSRPMEFIAKYSYPAFLVHHVLINWIISHFENKFSIVECWWMFAIILLLTFFIGYLVNCSVVALTKLIRSNA